MARPKGEPAPPIDEISTPRRAQPTILELLNRLRWDGEMDPTEYSLGYWDRVAREIIEAPLTRVDWEDSDKFALCLADETGRKCTVPLHRIRRVWKGELLVWHREGPEGALQTR